MPFQIDNTRADDESERREAAMDTFELIFVTTELGDTSDPRTEFLLDDSGHGILPGDGHVAARWRT